MKKLQLLMLGLLFTGASCSSTSDQVNKKDAFEHAEKQTQLMLREVEKAKQQGAEGVIPRTLTETGDLRLVKPRDWTSGFFPGVLWFLHEYTGKEEWREEAEKFTAYIENEKFDKGTHDLGFKIYGSFGQGNRILDNPEYRDVVIQAAKTLTTRYNPKVKSIRSWDHNADKWDFPVIVDNMMNLELLFAATRFTGDSTYYEVAVNHANTTLANHFRDDFSSYHVVDYNPETGEVQNKHTHQGYAHSSAWARGQAWGLYGYTMSFRETGMEKYLQQAEEIADFILNHPNLPEDMVPYWDFDAPNPEEQPRDVSAAAVTASALLELSTYSDKGETYRAAADKILQSLYQSYTAPVGSNRGFILLHSTGHKPADSEVDVPLNYADYYYLEALLRQDDLEKDKPLSL